MQLCLHPSFAPLTCTLFYICLPKPLSCILRLHPSFFAALSCSPPFHTLFHTSFLHPSHTPRLHTNIAHFPCTPPLHTSLTPLSCTQPYTLLASLSCTPLMHPYITSFLRPPPDKFHLAYLPAPLILYPSPTSLFCIPRLHSLFYQSFFCVPPDLLSVYCIPTLYPYLALLPCLQPSFAHNFCTFLSLPLP